MASWLKVLLCTALVWGIPVLLSMIVIGALCLSSECRANQSSIESLRTFTGDLIPFLGVVTAIMVAVITTLYLRGMESIERGFLSFEEALNQLRIFPIQIENDRDNFSDECQQLLNKWIEKSQNLAECLKAITPEWRGFQSSPKTNDAINDYRNRTETITKTLNGWTSKNRRGRLSLLNLSEVRYTIVRGVQVNLFIMSRGVVGRELVSRLLILSISLSVLLIVTLVVRSAVGFDDNSLFQPPTALNLFLCSFLPMSAISHIVGFIVAVWIWRNDTKALEALWPS